MSILINMEIPTKCCECLLAKLSPTGESLICNYMLSRVPWDEKPSDCPLVPVPPYGRLIDADELYRRIKTECNPYGKPTINFADGNKVMDMIEAAPTIIPAEEDET